MTLAGKTLFITGASRGIGLAIALRAARDGANIAIAAKTAEPHKHLPGTIYSAAEEIEKAGGKALPLIVDVRDETSVMEAVEQTAAKFGGIDICVNNASAIQLTPTEATDMKRYGMSMCVLGMADEFKDDGIAFNALWPRTGIATAAIKFALAGDEGMSHCRTPEIMADAAWAIFNKPAREFSGNFLIDDTFLYGEGERDFDKYRVDPDKPLMPDFFVPADSVPPPGVKIG